MTAEQGNFLEIMVHATEDEIIHDLEKQLATAEQAKNAAYRERNQLVALLARMFPATVKQTEIAGWDPEWSNCVFIDTPAGQLSWYYHDSEAGDFNSLPLGALATPATQWDGHTTEEKYERVQLLRGMFSNGHLWVGEKQEPEPGQSWVLCANLPHGVGVALEWIGTDVTNEVDAVGNDLSDLGLDDAPEGISVWQGRYRYEENRGLEEHYTSSHPEGGFRSLLPQELAQLAAGKRLWNDR